VPVQVQALTFGVSAITGGSNHSCAIVNGAAKCWGFNQYGQLGNGTTTDSLLPVQVQGLSAGVTAIASGGGHHTCALVGGTVRCWGNNDSGQLGNGTTTDSLLPVQVQGLPAGVSALAAGASGTCVIVNGAAQCWGLNSGQVGNGTLTISSRPVQVLGLTSGVTAIVTSSYTSNTACAIVDDAIQCWGNNYYGQLGSGNTTNSWTPVPVVGL